MKAEDIEFIKNYATDVNRAMNNYTLLVLKHTRNRMAKVYTEFYLGIIDEEIKKLEEK
jgi:hypothetical protein